MTIIKIAVLRGIDIILALMHGKINSFIQYHANEEEKSIFIGEWNLQRQSPCVLS